MDYKYIFVYGSLMNGFWNYNKALKGKAITEQDGYVLGNLYHLEEKGYPALVEGTNVVKGQLIKIPNDQKLIATLDEIENFHGAGNKHNEYELKKVNVFDKDHKIIATANAYFYNTENDENFKTSAKLILNGDWRYYMEHLNQSTKKEQTVK